MQLKSNYLQDARIVVIGAGAMGAAISYRLAQAGAEVITVERRYPGSGTTGGTFAWLNGFSKTPRDYHRLNVLSIRDHQDLADELDGEWVHVHGGLHWARADNAIKLSNLRETVQRIRGWGARLDQTTPEVAMRELEPDLWIDPEVVQEVYLVHREGWLDAAAMAHGVMSGAVQRYGARLEQGNVVGFNGPDGAVSGVRLEDGREIEADVIVNAAGPEAARVAALAGVTIPMDRQIGMLISTAPAPVRLRHVVIATDVNLRPDGGSRMLVQLENMDSHAVEGQPMPLDAPIIQAAMERGREVAPGLRDIPPQAIRFGIRPMPRDGLSIVGFEPGVSGLYTAVTHSGITLSARLSLLVAEELAGGEVVELAPYRPKRFVS